MYPVEKQQQDVEGESQAAKDHATQQEAVAALGLEYLQEPEGKQASTGAGSTQGRARCSAGHTEPAPLQGCLSTGATRPAPR